MENEDDDELEIAFLRLCEAYLKLKTEKSVRKVQTHNRESYLELKNVKRVRRWNVRPNNKDRRTGGYYNKIFCTMKEEDPLDFFIHTRMTKTVYDMLIKLVGKHLINYRQQIGPKERLAVTILYLAQGASMQTIASQFKMGKSTVRMIILQTCHVLWEILSPNFISDPTCELYESIAADFENIWNLPNCVGAIDGKHIAIRSPPGSMYLNYKNFHSIVLMATCDAKYIFTTVNIGKHGSLNEGGFFETSKFGRELLANKLPLPQNKPLSDALTQDHPHYFVGSIAFPLKINIMRPYPTVQQNQLVKNYNKRISRALQVIENSFGILTARWRILRTTIECSPENSETIILGCIALHNFIMMNDADHWYCPEKYADWDGPYNSVQHGNWRLDVKNDGGPLFSIRSSRRKGTINAYHARNLLAEFFLNEEDNASS